MIAAGRQRSFGFSLLEVMVALLVLAIAMTALVQAAGHRASVQNDLKATTLANWVASNAIEEVRLQEEYPSSGSRNGRVRMGQQEWQWEMDIQETEDPDIMRLDVSVALRDDPEQSISSLSGFIGR